MKTKVTALVLFLLAFTLSCHSSDIIKGNGHTITKNIEVSAFDKIEIKGNISVHTSSVGKNKNKAPLCYYTRSNGATLEITTDENIYNHLHIEVSKNKLTIKTNNNQELHPTLFVVNTQSEGLKEISVSGEIDFFLKSPLSGDELKINASGASDVYLKQPLRYKTCKIKASGASDLTITDLICNEFESHSSGASDLTLGGEANRARYEASGSSDIKAYKFEVNYLTCKASGSSDMDVYAKEELEASASGSSDINYKGNPRNTIHTSGAGDISKK